MSESEPEGQRMLLMDTCGERAQVALARGSRVVRSEVIVGRASAGIVAVARGLLEAEGLVLADLDGIGVVAGPGSFTGVRTGLATAKALCEVAAIALASVSRLEVLADAAGVQDGFAVLDAGRGSLYVRQIGQDERERLESVGEFEKSAAGREVVVAEEKVAKLLEGLAPKLVELQPRDMLRVVQRTLAAGGTDVAWADANYVRAESEIYARPGEAKTC